MPDDNPHTLSRPEIIRRLRLLAGKPGHHRNRPAGQLSWPIMARSIGRGYKMFQAIVSGRKNMNDADQVALSAILVQHQARQNGTAVPKLPAPDPDAGAAAAANKSQLQPVSRETPQLGRAYKIQITEAGPRLRQG